MSSGVVQIKWPDHVLLVAVLTASKFSQAFEIVN